MDNSNYSSLIVGSAVHSLLTGDDAAALHYLEEAQEMDRWCQDQMAAVGGG